jgi:membrane-anchored protein YejM (alkaline phosphatase superfamily)
MNTGSRLGGDPAVGSWATYGLGSENQNLPGYVVMTELAYPQGGATNWSNGFLPTHYQGTRLRSEGSPLLDLASQSYKSREHQRRALDELSFLNRTHLEAIDEENDQLAARMESYELAYRMQMEIPNVIDLSKETKQTLDMYGLDQPDTKTFGRQCLMARRLVESGVRFVQIFSGGWDSHDYLERGHSSRIHSVDKPMAALIKDLKRSGLLEDTVVVWTGEFGRTPDNNKRGGVYSLGRGHNNNAMTMLMAGGGVKPGVVGATDELGSTAVECVHPIRDFHVTLMHLLGLDDNKLTYFHGGRHKQLSQFGGTLIPEIIA